MFLAPEPLGCVVMQCGYNALTRQVFSQHGLGFTTPVHEWKDENYTTPIWFGQGDWDMKIMPRWSTGHYNIIRARGVPASLYTFQQEGHTTGVAQLEHQAEWIGQIFERGSVPPDPVPKWESPQLFGYIGEHLGPLEDVEHSQLLNVPPYDTWTELEHHKYKLILLQAVILPDARSMLTVLKAGLPIDSVDANQRTALHLALANLSLGPAQMLIQFDAD